ncbi:hypothetical protein L6164_018230 [Bauhinia variegata]|uniref:Uncharacterized protein n=1 Tax=Bauhinia variegata TaxID=167791 RepID=A0ACB9NFB4_BAUVA|nr:hypothetical protein L6164_018230 [Bauhinia variegata]
MAAQVCENLAMINGDDEFKGMEFSEINCYLLLSSMEEPREGDESDDDDRLDSLIKSLEAKISGTTMDGYDELTCSNGSQDHGQPWNLGEMVDQDYWATSCDFEMEYVNMDVLASSPWDGSWCLDSYGGEMDGISDIFYVNKSKMNDDVGFVMGDQYVFNSFLEREL